MEKLLYESKGYLKPQKRAAKFDVLRVILIILALFIWVISFFAVRGIFTEATILAVIAVIIAFGTNVYTKKVNQKWDLPQLRLYENRIEGVQINPMVEFALAYEEISDVQIVEILYMEALVIKTARKTYSVYVNDIEYAYSIIDKKLEQLERI